MQVRSAFTLLLIAVSAPAQTGRDPDSVLQQARARLQAISRRLERYVCIETVERGYYRRVIPDSAKPRDPCLGAAPAENDSLRLESTDRVRLEVTVSGGRELHSWPGATRFDSRDVDELIRDGPVATGSFGAYLTSIFDREGVIFQYKQTRTSEGGSVFEYHYHVPLEASRFEIKLAGAWKTTAYEGDIWLNPETLDLERLTIHADSVPPEAAFCQADTTLDYQLARIGDSEVLLPRQAQLEIVQKTGRESRNVTSFASCREYHAESEVSFDIPPETAAAPRTGGRGRVSIPIGLQVTLALESAIDTATAAAGDPISAKVVKPVRRPGSSEELIPAGAIVRGRIRRVEHHLLPEPYFLVALSFNRVEIKGAVSGFVARSEADPVLAKSLGANVEVRDSGIWFWGVGTFLFPSGKPHYVIPAGFESKWFTLATGAR